MMLEHGENDEIDNEGSELQEMTMILLQFTLEEERLEKFVEHATDFALSLEKSLTESERFADLKVVILGAGETSCGTLVIAAVNYIINKSASASDINEADTTIDYILDIIDQEREQLEENFNFKDVRSVMDETHLDFSSSEKAGSSVKLVVSIATGSLALVGLAAIAIVGAVVHSRRRKRNYEKIPLLTEESQQRKWFKLPWGKKEVIIKDEKF